MQWAKAAPLSPPPSPPVETARPRPRHLHRRLSRMVTTPKMEVSTVRREPVRGEARFEQQALVGRAASRELTPTLHRLP
jgi:hypothetical protein